MTQIIYDLSNVIDWSNSSQDIITKFNSKKDPGLITYFHGHAILLQEISIFDKMDNRKSDRDRVEFKLDDLSRLVIPSHNIIVTKYMIDIRADRFMDIPIENFIAYYPECRKHEFISSRKSMTWNEICLMEKRIRDSKTTQSIESNTPPKSQNQNKAGEIQYETGIISPTVEDLKNTDNSSPKFGEYTQKIYLNSKRFCKSLATVLPKKAKILDLGGSDEPWFSFLCAENGMKVFTFDISKPSYPNQITKKGITYIFDDMNNLYNYKDILSNLDFIFCRNISPPQQLWNWYDPEFIKIWKTMIEIINEKGVIYWEQMGNATDIPDTFFMNHSIKYFKDFFASLGLHTTITKYGYLRFKIMKNQKYFLYPWNSHETPINDNKGMIIMRKIRKKLMKKDLYEIKDYASLLKHYALQIQSFYEANDFESNHNVEITGNPICAKIARILLLENFQYTNATIIGNSKKTTLKIKGKDQLFTLTNTGLDQDDYFLIDEDQDKRFTQEYTQIFENMNIK